MDVLFDGQNGPDIRRSGRKRREGHSHDGQIPLRPRKSHSLFDLIDQTWKVSLFTYLFIYKKMKKNLNLY